MRGNTEEEKWCVCAGIPALKDTQYNMMLILRISKRMGLRGRKKKNYKKTCQQFFSAYSEREANVPRFICQ